MMSLLAALAGLSGQAADLAPPAALRVTRDAAGQLLISEGDSPVLRYNVQPVPVPAGVDGPYAVVRSGYIHPLFGLNGEVLTQDYAKDHPHHRGIYWAWPEVSWKGVVHDLHALQGVFARPEKIVRMEDGPAMALIEAVNLWAWEDREPVVRETVRIQAHKAAAGQRCIDLALCFEGLQAGVTIARRHQDAYGGLNLRFAALAGQQITQHTGPMRFPAAENWGELVGTPPGGQGPVGILILPYPGNPTYPEEWVAYPELNWLQPATPASGTTFALEPGQPLELRYRIVIRAATAQPVDAGVQWRACQDGWIPLAEVAGYRSGQDTAHLRAWEQRLARCPPGDRPAIEAALLALLAAPKSSTDLKRWVCDQLKCYGAVAVVPALVPLLGDGALAAPAAAALETLPDAAVGAALRQALPGLATDRQGQVIAVLGARRDTEAVPILAELAGSEVPAVRDAAAEALGAIGTTAAATALAHGLASRPATVPRVDAALRCADRLAAGPVEARVSRAALLRTVLAQAPADHQRQAALIGLADAAPAEALATATGWLASGTARDRCGAAAVLRRLPADAVTTALVSQLPQLADAAALVAIEVLASRPDPRLIPAVTPRLGDSACGAAAARVLGQVGDAGCVADLAALGVHRSEAGDAAWQALLALTGPGVDAAIRGLVQSDAPALRRLAADLLTTRLAAASLPDMMGLARDPDPAVSRRAFDTLGDLGDAALVAPLVALLPGLAPSQRRDALGALAQVTRRAGDPGKTVAELLRVAPSDPALRAEVVGSLHAFPGDVAGAALKDALGGADAALAEAAGRALLKWPSAPGADLQEAVKQALARAPTEPLRAVLEKARAHLSLLATRNLCLGRPVTSSHPWQANWGPELAVDGIIATTSYWSCAISPSMVTVDLGELIPVEAVRVVNYWDGTRFYQYTVELSADGTAWIQVADHSRNALPATEEGTLHHFDRRQARYVRVTMLGNSANPGMHIAELQAFSQLPAQE